MTRPAPTWWRELQNEFGRSLQYPLVSSRGHFEPAPGSVSPRLCEALSRTTQGVQLPPRARIAVYQRQYWMRLFASMQSAFPRLTHVLGAWTFNHLAAAYLRETPPAAPDLDRCTDGFRVRVTRALRAYSGKAINAKAADLIDNDPMLTALGNITAPRELLRQALSMDEAQRRAHRRGTNTRALPPSFDWAKAAHCQLCLAPSFGLVREDWSLATIGFSGAAAPERPAEIKRHRKPQYWVFYRGGHSVASQRIPSVLARLLTLCATQPLDCAAQAVRAACQPAQREMFDQQIDEWLRMAATLGWCTLSSGSDSAGADAC